MKNRLFILLILLLGVSILACGLPSRGSTPVPIQFQDTPTVFQPPTQTPIPEFLSFPTLTPGVQIEDADRSLFYGDWERALLEYKSAFDSSVDLEIQSAALVGMGRAHKQLGHYRDAIDILNRVPTEYPGTSQVGAANIALAQAYEMLYRHREAADAYAEYLENRSGLIDSYIHENRGDALIAAGDYLGAIEAYQSSYAAPRVDDPLPIEIKIANAYAAIGEYNTALVAYQEVYSRTTNDYTKAQVDYLMGDAFIALGQIDSAYSAYLDAVENYPLSYDAYQALILLVESGYPISEFDRGLVDYFAGQYNLSIAAFDRYLAGSSELAGTAYYYKGMAYLALDNPGAAIASWDLLIQSYLADDFWDEAWEEKAFTQWAYLNQYSGAIQTLLDFVDGYSYHTRASEFLFNAGRIAERDGDLGLAAQIWERIPSEYPTSEYVPRAIFLAGIAYFRSGNYTSALSTFEWFLGSSAQPKEKSAAYFWIAKTYQALGNESDAQIFFSNAANQDPTGYYSERARDILIDRSPFEPPVMFDLAYDSEKEKAEAEGWMRSTFAIPDGTDLSGPGPLTNDPRFIRGTELWNLGFYDQSRLEFESLRTDILQDPVDNYRLANYLVDLGLYRPAIFASRQVLNILGMDDAQTIAAPIHFNHVRFGCYYRDLILPIAEAYGFHPLFLFSVVRQESLFEGFVRSSAGAHGLMQIMPATGTSISANLGWPLGYTAEDLYRPKVSITFGTDYLDAQRTYFGGDLFAALAAYNAGPGNATIWRDLAGGDPDLFLEIIRFEETRTYIQGIYEVFSIYRRLYDRSP